MRNFKFQIFRRIQEIRESPKRCDQERLKNLICRPRWWLWKTERSVNSLVRGSKSRFRWHAGTKSMEFSIFFLSYVRNHTTPVWPGSSTMNLIVQATPSIKWIMKHAGMMIVRVFIFHFTSSCTNRRPSTSNYVLQAYNNSRYRIGSVDRWMRKNKCHFTNIQQVF